MPHATGETIRRPHQHDIILAAVGSGHHLIEGRALRLRAADPVGILLDDLEAPLFRQPAQI